MLFVEIGERVIIGSVTVNSIANTNSVVLASSGYFICGQKYLRSLLLCPRTLSPTFMTISKLIVTKRCGVQKKRFIARARTIIEPIYGNFSRISLLFGRIKNAWFLDCLVQLDE